MRERERGGALKVIVVVPLIFTVEPSTNLTLEIVDTV